MPIVKLHANLDGDSAWDGASNALCLPHQASGHLIFRAAGQENPMDEVQPEPYMGDKTRPRMGTRGKAGQQEAEASGRSATITKYFKGG